MSIMTLVPGRVGRARPGGRGRRLVVHLDEVELGEAQLGQPDPEGGPIRGARLLRATASVKGSGLGSGSGSGSGSG